MPMIDVTAAVGAFADKRKLMKDLTAAMMRWEKVPPIALFRENTAAFVHELPADSLSNAAGESKLRPRGDPHARRRARPREEARRRQGDDRDRRRGRGRPTLAQRTWVLISEAPERRLGIDGVAYTNAEIADAARRELAQKAGKP